MSDGELLTQAEIDALLYQLDEEVGGEAGEDDELSAETKEQISLLGSLLVEPVANAFVSSGAGTVVTGTPAVEEISRTELQEMGQLGPAVPVTITGSWAAELYLWLPTDVALASAVEEVEPDAQWTPSESNLWRHLWQTVFAEVKTILGQQHNVRPLNIDVGPTETAVDVWFEGDDPLLALTVPWQVGEAEAQLVISGYKADLVAGARLIGAAAAPETAEAAPVQAPPAGVPPAQVDLGAPAAEAAPAHPFPQLAAGTGDERIDLLADIPLEVSVELGRTRRRLADILALGPGSLLELERLAGEAVDVLVNGRLVARGEVVVIDENFGVRITDVVNPRTRALQEN